MMQVAWGTATDRGRYRRTNEDALLAEPPVFLVSDGMGGHAAGEVAAAIVVDEFRSRAGEVEVEADWVTRWIITAGRRPTPERAPDSGRRSLSKGTTS